MLVRPARNSHGHHKPSYNNTPLIAENELLCENALVISLKRSYDSRLAPFMARNIWSGNLEVVEAIDGKELTCPNKYWQNQGIGTYACLLSHIKAIQYAKEKEWECVCIFEDDITFAPNLSIELNKQMAFLPKDWDMLWLGGNEVGATKPINKYFGRLYGCYGAYGYILRNTVYDFLLNELIKLDMPCDDVYFRYQKSFKTFKTRTRLVNHIGHVSDRQTTRKGLDGVAYEKAKIGIGITTCGRKEVFNKSLEKVKEFSDGAKIFVYEDTLKEGVSIGKNKCLEALDDCDYIFLLDDDIYPVKEGWMKLYVDAHIASGNNHFNLIYEKNKDGTPTVNRKLKTDGALEYYSHPGGTMMFLTKECIKLCGGFDCSYRYGHGHTGFSKRVYNTGLNKEPFINVAGAMNYFFVGDYEGKVKGVLPDKEKKLQVEASQDIFRSELNEKGFKPYKKDNYVASIYLMGAKHLTPTFPRDRANIKQLEKWAKSLLQTGITGVLFHNCFTKNDIDSFAKYPVKFIYTDLPQGKQSGLYRFELYDKFIKKYGRYIDNIFFSDSTDIDVLKNPFTDSKYRRDKIFVGDEPDSPISNKWILDNSTGFPKYRELVKNDSAFSKHKLLNAGLCGGSLEMIAPFIERMAQECSKIRNGVFEDMPIINYLAFTEFKDKISFGRHLNTVFKGYEKKNTTAYFRHK